MEQDKLDARVDIDRVIGDGRWRNYLYGTHMEHAIQLDKEYTD
jgi:hypothetical protein